MKTKKKWRNWL